MLSVRYLVKIGGSLEAVCLSVFAAGALTREGAPAGKAFPGNCISHLARTARIRDLQARSEVRDSAVQDVVTHLEDSRIHAKGNAWMCP